MGAKGLLKGPFFVHTEQRNLPTKPHFLFNITMFSAFHCVRNILFPGYLLDKC